MGIYDIYALWNTIQLVLEWCGSYNTHGKLSKTSRTVSYRIPYLSHKKLGAIISIQTSKRIQKKRTAKKRKHNKQPKNLPPRRKVRELSTIFKGIPSSLNMVVYTPAIPALGRPGYRDGKFKANLDYKKNVPSLITKHKYPTLKWFSSVSQASGMTGSCHVSSYRTLPHPHTIPHSPTHGLHMRTYDKNKNLCESQQKLSCFSANDHFPSFFCIL